MLVIRFPSCSTRALNASRPASWASFATTLKLAALIAVATLAGCATNPVSGNKNVVLMSEEQEIALGKQNHQAVLKQYGVYNAPKLQAKVNRIGQELARLSHRPHLNYTFTLLDSPEVNAFALPGGYIYITRGILAYMNSEEELAGVLGHELGHVTARHGVRQQAAQIGGGLLSAGVAILTGNDHLAQGANIVASAMVRGYGRKHELEADRLGAEYLAKFGYDPNSMLDVIGILKNQELYAKSKQGESGKPQVSYHGVFDTHPSNDKCLQEVIAAAARFANPNPVVSDREGFVRDMNDMIFGDSESQGIIQGNRFFHQSLNMTITYPDGWRLINQPDSLVGVNSASNQIIQMQLANDQGKPDSAAGFLQRTFPDLRALQKISPKRAIAVTELNSRWGKRPARVAAVVHGQQTLVLLAVGEGEPPGQAFLETVKSVKPLSADDRRRAKARQIKLRRVKPGESYQGLASTSVLGKQAEAQLRLLNGQYPSGELTAGQLIKWVE